MTIDELLSGAEILSIAEEDGKQKQQHFRRLVCVLLDLSGLLLGAGLVMLYRTLVQHKENPGP